MDDDVNIVAKPLSDDVNFQSRLKRVGEFSIRPYIFLQLLDLHCAIVQVHCHRSCASAPHPHQHSDTDR